MKELIAESIGLLFLVLHRQSEDAARVERESERRLMSLTHVRAEVVA